MSEESHLFHNGLVPGPFHSPGLRPTMKITPAPHSALVHQPPGAVLEAVLTTTNPHAYDFKAALIGDPFHIDNPATTVEELREDGHESVEVWYRGVRLGVIDLTAWEKLSV
jgi:hypothetical protein